MPLMIQTIWAFLSRYYYHLVAIPCMSMFPYRYCGKHQRLVTLAAAVASGTVSLLLHALPFPGGMNYLLHQSMHIACLLLFSCLLYRGNFYSMLLVLLLAMSVAGQTGFIYGGCISLIWGADYPYSLVMVRDVLGYGTFGCYFLVLKKYLNFTSFYLNRRDHLILLGIAYINFAASCIAIRYFSTTGARILFYSVASFTTFTITFLVFRFTKEHQNALEQQVKLQAMQISQTTLAQLKEASTQMHELRHEFSNYLIYAQRMLQDKQYAQLDAYLAEIKRQKIPVIDAFTTGNTVVNAILNQKSAYAKSLGIHTEFQIVLPDPLPIDDLTLCSLFGNLLNNAIEACAQQDEPFIRLTVYPVKSYLALRIDNSVPEDVLQKNPQLQSTKEDSRNHGIGIKVLRDIVKKYDGILHYQMVDPHCFSVEIMLKL